MGVVVLIALVASLFVVESPRRGARAVPRLADVLVALRRAVSAPGSGGLVLFIATYKLGENMAEVVWKPWLVDAGFGDAFIGGTFGVTGMVTSIAGSLVGGVLATHVTSERALWIPAAGRVLPLLGQAAITAWGASPGWIVAVVGLEHFFGGALTTVVFALMMARVDKRIGASHYTLLAGIEVFGKMPAGPLAGVLAQHAGYAVTFLAAAALTAAQLATIPALRKR
jgi:hypothetical protein